MKYTINGKEYSEYEINLFIAESGIIPVAINEDQDSALKAKSSSVLINDIVSTYEYNPCNNPADTWPIIEKVWGELSDVSMNKDCEYRSSWEFLVREHNCSKLMAACICFIEWSEQ